MATLFVTLLAASALMYVWAWFLAPPSSHAATGSGLLAGERSEIVNVRTIAGLALAAYAFEWWITGSKSELLSDHRWHNWLGLAFFFAGAGLLNLSLAALGPSFAPTARLSLQNTLVTSGPYKYVRHPIYGSYVLATTGLLLVFFSWAFLILMGFHLARLFRRIPMEEKSLDHLYDVEYKTYVKGTGRLFPKFGVRTSV